MQEVFRTEASWGRAVLVALAGLVAAAALLFGARPAEATVGTATPTTCPGFEVLHNDRIGAAVFPQGVYTITLQASDLSCKSSAGFFARFLEDYDGILPKPWKITNEGSGKASFLRGAVPGFSVELTGKDKPPPVNPDLGKLCPDTFKVNATAIAGSLRFTKGSFLIYLPAGTGITCNRAAVLFNRFLAVNGPLPQPWKLTNQTATFYKPSNPTRSAFRIEPLNGSGRR